MKVFSLLLISYSLSFISCTEPVKCSLTLVDHKYYDLCHIHTTNFTVNSTNFSLSFGAPQLQSCNESDTTLVWGTARNKEGQCFDFTKIETDPVVDALPHIDGIQIVAASEKFENKYIDFKLAIYCDKDKSAQGGALSLQLRGYLEDNELMKVSLHSSSFYGCAITPSNKVIDFLMDNKNFFAPILVVLGIIYCFLGLRHFNTIIYLTLFGATLSFAGLILEETASFSRSQLIILVVLGFLFIADISLTYCFKKTQTMGYIIVGTAFGAVNGVLVYDTMLSPILRGYAGNTIFYIVVSICSLTAAGIAAWIQKDGFIIFTAFIGSFLIVRPISTILGGFPSEIAVSSGLEVFDTTTYWYLVAVLVIAALGIKYQKKYYRYILRDSKVKDEMITFSEYMQLF